MDCDTCKDLLLDLHYDELDADRAEEARAHLAGCDECRASSERLARTRALVATLSLPEPPTHSAAVMAALAAAGPVTAAVSGRVSAVIPIERAREARAAGWLQRVGELAMRRQVAMVAISLLMVGLGLRYLPFRSPTQSVNSELTQPEVIPATEVQPQPAPTPAAAPVAVAPARARLAAPRPSPSPVTTATASEGRASNRVANLDALRGVGPGYGSSVGSGSVADLGASRGRSGSAATPGGGSASTERSAVLAESPVAQAPAAAAAPSYNSAGPVGQDEERQLQAAMPAAPVPAPSNWATARNSADNAMVRGDREASIAGYQRALALDPPPAERQALALALVRALSSAGRVEEANRVRAQYLTPASDTANLARDVPVSVPRTQTSAGMAQPSAPRPTSTRPARRSINNVQSDFNQSAY